MSIISKFILLPLAAIIISACAPNDEIADSPALASFPNSALATNLPEQSLEAKMVTAAEHQKNLDNCRYGLSSCNRGILNHSEVQQVAAAEHQRNLDNCRYGLSSCNRGTLNHSEVQQVAAAEHQRNLDNCRYGLSSCDRSALDSAARATTANTNTAPQVAASTPSSTSSYAPAPVAPTTYQGGCAENGSCYGDISTATGRPKTVAVRGYRRKDGTYVRGHYRSRKR